MKDEIPKKLNLGRFRELTQDLPSETEIWILDTSAWKLPVELTTLETQMRHNDGGIAEYQKKQIEIRLKLAKG